MMSLLLTLLLLTLLLLTLLLLSLEGSESNNNDNYYFLDHGNDFTIITFGRQFGYKTFRIYRRMIDTKCRECLAYILHKNTFA